MKPFIDQSFWSDPDIEAAKTGVKLAALWLITNTQTSLLGVCGASSARFTFETGLPAEALDATLQALPKSFKRFGGVIFLRNYMRHQFGSGETLTKNNFFKALKTLFRAIKDDELKAAVLSEYPEFDSSTTPSQGLPKPKEGKEGEGQEREGKIRARRKRTPLACPAFAEFWASYPKREAVADAEQAWIANGCAALLPQILAAVLVRKSSAGWTKDGGQFIPLPATWLNRRGWEDQPVTATAPAKPAASYYLPGVGMVPAK